MMIAFCARRVCCNSISYLLSLANKLHWVRYYGYKFRQLFPRHYTPREVLISASPRNQFYHSPDLLRYFLSRGPAGCDSESEGGPGTDIL
jgi:hypothetical protein